jgi:hypothetical protein
MLLDCTIEPGMLREEVSTYSAQIQLKRCLFAVLGFELRSLSLLGRHCTT